MSLYDITAVDLASTDTAVVRTLRTGETTLGPAIGVSKLIEESVLLLETEPGLLILVRLHQLGAVMSVVELVWYAVGIPALGEDEDVVTTAEGIGEDGNGTEVDIGVFTGSLASRGTVKVPLGEIINRGRLLGQSLYGKETLAF